MTLTDKQAQIRDVVLGPGTDYRWQDGPPAWWTERDLRTSDTVRAGSHGVRGGPDRYGAQTLTGTVLIAATPDTLGGLIDTLDAAFAPSDTNLAFTTNFLGRERVRFGRPRKFAVTVADGPVSDTAIASFQFDALDPFSYSGDEHSATSGPAVPGAGVDIPFTLPFTLPAGTTGTLDLPNAGTAPAEWTARIDGPASGVRLTDTATGERLDFSANGGVTLGASEWLDIDSRDRSVMLDGIASRSLYLATFSRWWQLAPGANSVRFESSGGTVTFTWRDAWY